MTKDMTFWLLTKYTQCSQRARQKERQTERDTYRKRESERMTAYTQIQDIQI